MNRTFKRFLLVSEVLLFGTGLFVVGFAAAPFIHGLIHRGGQADYALTEAAPSGEPVVVTVSPQANGALHADSHHAALVARGSRVTAFDLSTLNVATGGTVSRTTANCYVVDRPGTYRFPLIYGNAVDFTREGASSAQDIAVSKTVYDPCPPGYCIPHKTAFTYFTSSGGNVTSVNNLNVVDKNAFTDPLTSESGWSFNTGGDASIFFPVPGYRSVTDGALSAIDSSGYAWTASPNANNTAICLQYAATSANPVYSGAQAHGLSVRAVKERAVE